jgi:hypothetical protein
VSKTAKAWLRLIVVAIALVTAVLLLHILVDKITDRLIIVGAFWLAIETSILRRATSESVKIQNEERRLSRTPFVLLGYSKAEGSGIGSVAVSIAGHCPMISVNSFAYFDDIKNFRLSRTIKQFFPADSEREIELDSSVSSLREVIADIKKVYDKIDERLLTRILEEEQHRGDSFVGITFQTPLGEVFIQLRHFRDGAKVAYFKTRLEQLAEGVARAPVSGQAALRCVLVD